MKVGATVRERGVCVWIRQAGRGGGVLQRDGGVEGALWFSLGDRACCHGAGPPIGGGLGQSHASTVCFIID